MVDQEIAQWSTSETDSCEIGDTARWTAVILAVRTIPAPEPRLFRFQKEEVGGWEEKWSTNTVARKYGGYILSIFCTLRYYLRELFEFSAFTVRHFQR